MIQREILKKSPRGPFAMGSIGLGIFAFAVGAAGLTVGCSSTSKNIHGTDEPFAETIILPSAKPLAAAVILPPAKLEGEYALNSLNRVSPFWTPDTNAVAHALSDLPDYLRRATDSELAHPLYPLYA